VASVDIKRLERCQLCRNTFTPIVSGQQFCSATCVRFAGATDELATVMAELDRMHREAFDNRKKEETA
jgi:hypothetical protein